LQIEGPVQVETEKSLRVQEDFPQKIDARFRLFKTQNIWTFIELDTATGRLWQVQYGVGDKSSAAGRFPISLVALAPEGKAGRFTLYETTNRWNYILLDQDTGRVWQAQYSLEATGAGVFPIQDPPMPKDAP